MQDTGIITFQSVMCTSGRFILRNVDARLLGMKAIILERRKWIKIKLENDENGMMGTS